MPISMQMKLKQSVDLDAKEIPLALRGGMAEALGFIETQVRKRTPQGVGGSTSGLRASIFGEVQESPGLFRGVVSSPFPHAIVIEEGRQPGQRMPPPSALIPWVGRFLDIEEGQTVEGVAFLVAKSIGRKGFEGKHMFAEGFAASRSEVTRIFERVGLRISNRIVKTDRTV